MAQVPSLLISLLLVATTVVSDRSEDQRLHRSSLTQERLARLAASAQQHSGSRRATPADGERPRIAQQDDHDDSVAATLRKADQVLSGGLPAGRKVWPGGTPSDTATFKSDTTTQGSSDPINIVAKADLAKSMQDLDKVMSDALGDMGTKMQSLFSDVSHSVKGESSKMFDMYSLLYSDSEERIRLVLREERSLEVTMMHGQYGKCCCKNNSAPGQMDTASAADDSQLPARKDYFTPSTCTWAPTSKLIGNFTKACPVDKEEYTEFLGRPNGGSIQDTMLELCSRAAEWKRFASNQIVNDCEDHSKRLNKQMVTLGSYLR